MSDDQKKNVDIAKVPEAEVADVRNLAVKSFLSSLPGLGPAAAEIFNYVFAPPVVKRQKEWMEAVAARLIELEKKVDGFKTENLRDNENFISTVLYATTLAIRTHEQEKLIALQNAVANVAENIPIEHDLEHMFLNFIDELTAWHLRVLKYFESPEEWFKQKGATIPNYSMGGAIAIFYDAFPDLAKSKDFARQVVEDLASKGLSANWESMHVMVSRGSMVGPGITPLGKQFLNFITSH